MIRIYVLFICALLIGCDKKRLPLQASWQEPAFIENGAFNVWDRPLAVFNMPGIKESQTDNSPALPWIVNINGKQTVEVSKQLDGNNPCLKYTVVSVDPSNEWWQGKWAVIERIFPNYSDFAGHTVTVQARVKTSSPGVQVSIGIQEGIYKSQPHSGSGQWETLTVTRPIPRNITQFYVTVGWDVVQAQNGVPTDKPMTGGEFYVDDIVGDVE